MDPTNETSLPKDKYTMSDGDSRKDLPLRSPSPTKIKRTEVASPLKHKRISSIDILPPSKRHAHSRQNSDQDSDPARQADTSEAVPPFPGIWQALLGQHDLLLILTTEYLKPDQLLTLFSIDKDFHRIVDIHATAWVKGAGRNWALIERPLEFTETSESRKSVFVNAMRYVPLGCYAHLCRKEKEVVYVRPEQRPDTPAQRMNNLVLTPSNPAQVHFSSPLGPSQPTATSAPHPQPAMQSPSQLQVLAQPQQNQVTQRQTPTAVASSPRMVERLVPTFKYLFMIIERLATIRSILRTLAWDHGMRFPAFMNSTLLKLWFLMDVRSNKARQAFLAHRLWFNKFDIFRSIMFFVKLDLLFNDTITEDPSPWLRRLMLAQKGFVPLDHLLLRTRFKFNSGIEKECARFLDGPGTARVKTNQRMRLFWEHEMFPYHNSMAYENSLGFIVVHNRKVNPLHHPENLILAEAARRCIAIGEHELTFFITYGYPRRVTPLEIAGLQGFFGQTEESLQRLPSTEMRPFWWKALREMCRFDKALHWAFNLSRAGLTRPKQYWSSDVEVKHRLFEDSRRHGSDLTVHFGRRQLVEPAPNKSLMPQIPGNETIMDLVARVSREAGQGKMRPAPQSAPRVSEPEPVTEGPEDVEIEQEPTVVYEQDPPPPEEATLNFDDFMGFDQDSDDE